MTRVKVAIRVRPLTFEEKSSGDEVVIEATGNKVFLKNLRASGSRDWEQQPRRTAELGREGRHFNYDYCFWSVDPRHPLFASQETIYEAVGVPVVETLLEGYNACVFAYGQSGTGKSYTINGNDSERGLLPRICSDLFDRIRQISNAASVIEVSFLELYKERVRDLLNFDHHDETLRVREHPSRGPFVEGLSRRAVTDVDQVTRLFRESKKNLLSKESQKRSHSIFTIRCLRECNRIVLSNELHLVDLAGSERASFCSDLKDQSEIITINKSLVALGIVVSSLANGASDPRRTIFVPFRNSVLTWLLKETLGGNCVTRMIATVSPARSAYKETLNTLRYAERAGNIRNCPIVNQASTTSRFLREMKTETELSKQTLASTYFKQGIILENAIAAYQHSVSYSPSKPTDAFNPFINTDYFEKLRFDNENFRTTSPAADHFKANNNPTLSEKSNSSNSGSEDLISEGKRPSLDADLNSKLSRRRTIELKFKTRRKIISKSCENLSTPEIVPLWKRFSRSLQDRERIENKKAGQSRLETLKSIEPLPLSLLKMFKNKTESMEDVKTLLVKDESVTPRELDILDNSDNIGVIEEETDSVLGSWCSSDVLSIMSHSGPDADAHGLVENHQSDIKPEPREPLPEDGLNLVRILVEENRDAPVPNTRTIPSPIRPLPLDSALLSESVCSSVETYNDSLNTPRCNLSEAEDCHNLDTRTETIALNQSHHRRKSSYSTDSVEGWNNVTSEDESTTFEDVEKGRRSYVSNVANNSTLHFSTITDERNVPSTLVHVDPGSPDSGFVSTKVFPATPSSLWRNNPETPRTLAEGRASGSSSDSITYVFVDQRLSKNSRNNSEERSSAESTGISAPEANSVIEIPRASTTRGDSIVTLDSLEVWKDAADSPRTLSVDSLVMERYLKMVNESNPDFEKAAANRSSRHDVRSVRTSKSTHGNVKERVDSTTSESSESSKKYGSDLIKLMSDVVRLLKRNKSEKTSANPSCHPQRTSCVNCDAVAAVYCPSTSSGSDTGRVLRRPKRPTDKARPDGGRKSEKDSFETLEADDEYRNVMKDSLKKEIRLIRKERDLVYRLLQKEKRKNSARSSSTRDARNNGNLKASKIRVEASSNSSFPEATSSSSTSSASSSRERGALIKSDFARPTSSFTGLEDIPFSRQRANDSSKESKVKRKVVVQEEEEASRRRIKYPTLRFGDSYDARDERYAKNNRQQQRSFERKITPDHFKTTNVSRDLGDSGLVDCCSGYWRHSSFHDTDDAAAAGVDKSVQTMATNARQESTRPKNAGFSSPKLGTNCVSAWQKPWLSAIKPRSSCRRSGSLAWSSDLGFLDDLLGADVYLELPDEFSRSESFAIPLPSRLS